jgi:hypothetical protein
VLRAAKDAVHDDEQLVLGPDGEIRQRRAPGIDRLGRDCLKRLVAERGQQMRLQVGAVVADR